jgi:chromosome segregation ATPase
MSENSTNFATKDDVKEIVKDEVGSLRQEMNGKFEDVHNEFDGLRQEMNGKFEDVHNEFDGLRQEMNGKFEDVHNEFDGLRQEMNGKFEAAFNIFATKDELKDVKSEVVEVKEDVRKILGIVEGMAAQLVKFEDERVSNQAAHDRMQDSIVNHETRIKKMELSGV